MNVITAPEPIVILKSNGSLFLAGTIDMGNSEDWQQKFIESMTLELARTGSPQSWTILNPRRKEWDSTWEQRMSNPQFYQQVDWEMQGLETADNILFYFAKDSKSPITFLELGMYAGWKAHVICPDGFYRKGNIEILCHKKNVPMYKDFDSFIQEIIKLQP